MLHEQAPIKVHLCPPAWDLVTWRDNATNWKCMVFAAPRVRNCPLSLTQDLMYSGRTHETVASSIEACMYEKSQVLHRSLPSDPSFPYDYIPSLAM